MNAEILNLLLDIGISSIIALIGWEIIPMHTPDEKKQWWNKMMPILKWAGSIATAVFTILLFIKIFE